MANGDPIIIPRKGTRTREKGGVRTIRPTDLGREYSDLQASGLFQDYPAASGELSPMRIGREAFDAFRQSANPGEEMLAGLPLTVRKNVIKQFETNPQLASLIVGDLDYRQFPTNPMGGLNPNLSSVIQSGGSGILVEELFDPEVSSAGRRPMRLPTELAGINIEIPKAGKKIGSYAGAGRKPTRFKSGAIKRTGRGDRPIKSIRRK